MKEHNVWYKNPFNDESNHPGLFRKRFRIFAFRCIGAESSCNSIFIPRLIVPPYQRIRPRNKRASDEGTRGEEWGNDCKKLVLPEYRLRIARRPWISARPKGIGNSFSSANNVAPEERFSPIRAVLVSPIHDLFSFAYTTFLYRYNHGFRAIFHPGKKESRYSDPHPLLFICTAQSSAEHFHSKRALKWLVDSS